VIEFSDSIEPAREYFMAVVNPAEPTPHGGIHLGDVGGNVEFSALGDIVGGDKIVNITTTIQISAEVVTTRPLIVASPYRGLDRFEDRDKALFFGRDQLIKSLLTQLSSTSILLVLGASGSGKSSLIRAGLLPALSELVGSRFRYFVLVPDVDPFESLRSSLISGGFSQNPGQSGAHRGRGIVRLASCRTDSARSEDMLCGMLPASRVAGRGKCSRRSRC
jgi:hypothetical protein